MGRSELMLIYPAKHGCGIGRERSCSEPRGAAVIGQIQAVHPKIRLQGTGNTAQVGALAK